VAYDAAFAFLGLYIVRPRFRGQGCGLKLWQAGMKQLGDRNIGLDGVVAQQDNYRKSGFHLEYRNIRYMGSVGQSAAAQAESLSHVSFDALLEYDRAIFQAPRERFLQCWIRQPQAAGCVRMRGGKLAGYGLIRRCREGYKIGPLFADDESIADELFRTLATHAVGATVYIVVPERNAGALALARRHGLQKVFESARMFTRLAPPVPINRVFGVTTFELG
jgi:ribosomal protein S18 acetylase RimI-like enzyme